MIKSRYTVVREAIEIVLRHLQSVPPSERALELQGRLADCLQEAELWTVTFPTDNERDAVMKRVLNLYVAVNRLEGERAAIHDQPAATG